MPLPNSEHGAAESAPFSEEDSPPTSLHPLADLEHPWLGLESFREETSAYFFGRGDEIAELRLRLRSQQLLVLYGRSGFGKTSILSAGLIPRLRREGYRAAIHRLSYGEEDPNTFEQLLFHLGMQDVKHAVPFPLPNDAASRLWLHIHRKVPWSGVTHLILDQFEELFTIETQRSGTADEVREALGILIQGAVPASIAHCLAGEETFFDYFAPDSQPVHVVLALRDDYVYALNRWRRHLPQLGQNYFELRALRGCAAFDVVFEPGCLRTRKREENGILVDADTGLRPIVSEATARRIVQAVAEKKDVPLEEIDAVPPILSLLCRELNERRYQQPRDTFGLPLAEIVFEEQETDLESILENFYERCLADYPEAVRIFIEEHLVSHSGIRLQNDERSIIDVFANGCEIPGSREMGRHAAGYGDRDAATTCLHRLVNDRLLSPIPSVENPRYELTHDLLCRIVYKSRSMRRERLEKERLTALLALNNPSPGLALGYFINFVRPLVNTLLSGEFTVSDKDPGSANWTEERYGNAHSTMKLFIFIPERIPRGRDAAEITRHLNSVGILKSVTIRRPGSPRDMLIYALYAGPKRHLVDFTTVTASLDSWVRRQAAHANVNPESHETLRFEAAALDSFETALEWWIADPTNDPAFRDRVKVFRLPRDLGNILAQLSVANS
jgi:hypothetical protein